MRQGSILDIENEVPTLQKQALSNSSRLNSLIRMAFSKPQDLMEFPPLHSVTIKIKFEHWVLEGIHKHSWDANRNKKSMDEPVVPIFLSRKYQGRVLPLLLTGKYLINHSHFLIILFIFNVLYFSEVKEIE